MTCQPDTSEPQTCPTDDCFAPMCSVMSVLFHYGDHLTKCTWWKDHRTCSCGWQTEWRRIWMPSVQADIEAVRAANAPEPDPQGSFALEAS